MQNINIAENGINKLLKNLKPHKAAGPDKIPSRILKATLWSISIDTHQLHYISLHHFII